MKVFILVFVALLLIGSSSSAKITPNEKRSSALEIAKANETNNTTKVKITQADTDIKQKEVHKRGISHYGGALANSGGLWPKTYASHYGYGLHLPSASSFSVHPLSVSHLHSPAILKYNTGVHYRALAAPLELSRVNGLSASSGLPTYAGLSPAVSHVHQASTAQPFIIRPGGAVVQSYSVTYPHPKHAVAVKPVHAFASVAPAQHLHPLQPVAAVHPANSFQTVHHIQPVQPAQPVAAVQPVQPIAAIQPIHHFQSFARGTHLHPVTPVQTIVQNSFVPAAPVPVFSPSQVAFPAIPTFPNPPAFPNIPTVPVIPQQPPIPDVPAVPAIPNIPTIPSIPNFPQPQVTANGFFPVNVQPPLHQKPPTFANVNPQAQFPGFGPIAGNNPDFGSGDAAPQIPVQSVPSPEPELPNHHPEPTQQPWKPVLHQPPIVNSPVGHPSHTLLPPYDYSPAKDYLPPAASSSHRSRIQQQYSIDSSLFDNLSDADIEYIFAEATLAAQRDNHNHHHTVHNYHSRY